MYFFVISLNNIRTIEEQRSHREMFEKDPQEKSRIYFVALHRETRTAISYSC